MVFFCFNAKCGCKILSLMLKVKVKSAPKIFFMCVSTYPRSTVPKSMMEMNSTVCGVK